MALAIDNSPAPAREFTVTIPELMRQTGLDLAEVELSLLRLETFGYINVLWRHGNTLKGRCNVGPEIADLLGALDSLTNRFC